MDKIPTLEEIAAFTENIWYKQPDFIQERMENDGLVDVYVGWVDDHTDKVNGGYEAESYSIHCGQYVVGTGRPGMKIWLENGFIPRKLVINGKDCTDKIEEFKQFILVGDKPFNV